MAISFTLNSSSSGGRASAITLPVTISAGDLLVAMEYNILGVTIPATPSGWALVNSFSTAANPQGTIGVIARIADGTEGGTSLTWFNSERGNHAAFSLTPDTTISSLGAVTGTDAASSFDAISLDATPSAGTLPLMLIYAGGSNGSIDVSPNGDFSERFEGEDGVELNATFYDTTDPTTTLTTSSGDTGRQTMALGNINLNFSTAVNVVVNVTGAAGAGAVGSVTTTGGASAAATGSEGTGAVGSAAAAAGADVPATGLEATNSVGSVAVVAAARVFIVASDAIGWSRASWGAGEWSQPILSDIGLSAVVGDVSVAISIQAPVTGLEVTAGVGSVTVTTGTGIDVDVTGVFADVRVSPRGVLVWGRVVPDPDTDWAHIAPTTTTSYTEIQP